MSEGTTKQVYASDEARASYLREKGLTEADLELVPFEVAGAVASEWLEVQVVVEGAVDETLEIRDPAYLDKAIDKVERQFKEDGVPTEVFVLHHLCDGQGDCVCAQYALDSHPAYTFGA